MKAFLLVFYVYLFIVTVNSSLQQIWILETIQTGVEELSVRGTIPYSLIKAVGDIKKITDKVEADDTTCKSCNIVVQDIIKFRRNGANKKSMKYYLNKLCTIFSEWGSIGCKGYVEIEIDTILFIIDNKQNLTSERVCAIQFQERKCLDPDAKKWEIPIPLYPSSNEIGIVHEKSTKNQLKILHLTDIHYDPLYKPESNAVCSEPLCCQTGAPNLLINSAGYWGDYHVCDMPLHSIQDFLSHIKDKYLKEIDMVYFTGDIISHRSWDTSKEQNTESIKEIYGLFGKIFENKNVYPILGNHEPHPTDFYTPNELRQKNVSNSWIFDVAVAEWSRWLPDDARATIRKGGYYSVLIKPGFRVIGLNSNVCFTSNLWLIYEDEDPYQQLTWLVRELLEAETLNERVHILSHIPPGELLCHKQWSNQYRKIVERFANTIIAQFNGHTHFDEFRVFFNPENSSEVANIAFNGGSFTTFVGFNPNFRIYHVNDLNSMVLDYDQYTFNLSKANTHSKRSPEWYKLYSFKQAYGLPDLSRGTFGDLLKKFTYDMKLLYKYFRFMVRDSDVKIKEGCGKDCLLKYLCYITAVETNEAVNC